jgi:hypothetical protein
MSMCADAKSKSNLMRETAKNTYRSSEVTAKDAVVQVATLV